MLKRIAPVALFVGLLAVLAVPLWAAPAATKSKDASPAVAITTAIATVTGIAISPLLGTGAYGAYLYWKAESPEEKARLPWFAQMSFWLPAVLIVGICAVKDSFGAALPPGFKKPLDVLEAIENKASGLVAAGAVIPFTMDTISKLLLSVGPQAQIMPTGLAALPFASIDLSWLLNLLTVPFGVAVFAFVWMASHAINVLILLSPWGAIDAVLKGGRATLLGVVTLSSTLNPWLSAGLSIAIIIISWLVAGWAFRLTVFGSIFCWDFFTLRRRRFTPQSGENKAFSGGGLCARGVPIRTYGRWTHEPQNGRWQFVYKPWLVLPERAVEVTANVPHLGRGMFISTLRETDSTLLILPPRYRGHEEEVVRIYRIEGGVQEAGLLKAWGVLRELFGGGSTQSQVV
jgi:MFS family permease